MNAARELARYRPEGKWKNSQFTLSAWVQVKKIIRSNQGRRGIPQNTKLNIMVIK
ncbi:MAG: hypothetical protein WDZ91_07440 [Paenibacillaceae bacterium]